MSIMDYNPGAIAEARGLSRGSNNQGMLKRRLGRLALVIHSFFYF